MYVFRYNLADELLTYPNNQKCKPIQLMRGPKWARDYISTIRRTQLARVYMGDVLVSREIIHRGKLLFRFPTIWPTRTAIKIIIGNSYRIYLQDLIRNLQVVKIKYGDISIYDPRSVGICKMFDNTFRVHEIYNHQCDYCGLQFPQRIPPIVFGRLIYVLFFT